MDDLSEHQDFGDDFHFERDPLALASILNDRGLTPKLQPDAFQTSLTPASTLPKRLQCLQDRFDFFEGKNGVVFYRPSAKFSRSSSKVDVVAEERGITSSTTKAFRSMKRGIRQDVMPKRLVRRSSPMAKGGTPFRLPFQAANRHPHTEKKLVPFLPPPHRQSISERKPIPGLEVRKSFLPQPAAKKSLHFQAEKSNCENFNFVRPLSPSPRNQHEPSRVEMILMREGLMGLPRDSLSLLRQSLSKTELMKMFEEDSTESFEALEMRLKTPKKVRESKLEKNAVEENRQHEKSDADVGSEPKTEDLAVNDEIKEIQEDSPASKNTRICVDSGVDVSHEIMTEGGDNSEVCEVQEECDEDPNEMAEVTLLERSVSMVDLRELPGSSKRAKTPRLLAKSTSEIDLRDQNAVDNIDISSRLRQALEAHREYVRERKEIESQMKLLMAESKKRREQFKLAWGVSPARINSLRQQQPRVFITNIQQVSISSHSEEVTDDASSAADEVFSPPSKKYLSESLSIPDEDDDCDEMGFSIVSNNTQITEDLEVPTENQDSSSDANFDEVEMEMTQLIEDSFSEKPRKKTVRFFNATPKKYSPISHCSPMIRVNVPVHVGGRAANMSFNERRCFTSTSMHAQTPMHAKKPVATIVMQQALASVNTPMALRNISVKAHEALASLYADDQTDLQTEEEQDDDSRCDAREKIDFDDSV